MFESLIFSLIPWALILEVILVTFFVTTVLWLLYIKVMKIKAWRERRKRRGWQKALLYLLFGPEVVVGLLADIVHNYTFSVLICLGLPPKGKITVTSRLQYYREKLKGNTWRRRWQKRVANFVCDKMLNKYDPDGKHC